MLFNAFVCAVALWSSAASGTFQFPDLNAQSKVSSNPPANATAAVSTRQTADRQRNLDKINFMDDFAEQEYNKPGNLDVDVSRGLVQMTLQLDRVMSPEGKTLHASENVVFSPASIAVTLALVMLGAGGQTLAEVTRVLGLRPDAVGPGNDSVHYKISALLAMFGNSQGVNSPTTTTVATGVFLQKEYPIKEKFLRISKNVYNSDVIPLDFVSNTARAGDTINRWVEWRTHGRIKGFLSSPPDPSTKVLLASALYFNGKWEHPFPISNTKRRPFFTPGPNGTDETIEVTMMVNAAEVPYYSDTTLGCKFVTLPYQGQQVAMHIVLPNARGYAELLKLKRRITLPILESYIANSRISPTIISLPRMKLESAFSLKTALETMGLRSLFDVNLSDLSNLSSGIVNKNISNDFLTFSTRMGGGNAQNPGLYADDVYHKVEMEVTETGTLGSAVTATSISRDGSRPTVRMDRPFLFFIRHSGSKTILFWGTVIRPI